MNGNGREGCVCVCVEYTECMNYNVFFLSREQKEAGETKNQVMWVCRGEGMNTIVTITSAALWDLKTI